MYQNVHVWWNCWEESSNKSVSLLKHYIDNYLSEKVEILYLFSASSLSLSLCVCTRARACVCVCGGGFWRPSFKTQLLHQAGSLKVHHHFPECGHSFMPFDQPFVQIERIKQRKEYVFVPEELCDSVVCVEQVFSWESRPRCDAQFQLRE
jgi:hypothetical protein